MRRSLGLLSVALLLEVVHLNLEAVVELVLVPLILWLVDYIHIYKIVVMSLNAQVIHYHVLYPIVMTQHRQIINQVLQHVLSLRVLIVVLAV